MQQYQQYQKNQHYQKYNKWNSCDCIQGLGEAKTIYQLSVLNPNKEQLRIIYESQQDPISKLIQNFQDQSLKKLLKPGFYNLLKQSFQPLATQIKQIIKFCKKNQIQVKQFIQQQSNQNDDSSSESLSQEFNLQCALHIELPFQYKQQIKIILCENGVSKSYKSFQEFKPYYSSIQKMQNSFIYIRNIKKIYFPKRQKFQNLMEIYSQFCYSKKQELILELYDDKFFENVRVKENKNYNKIFIQMIGQDKEYEIQKQQFQTIQDVKNYLIQQMKDPNVTKIEDISIFYDGRQLKDDQSLDSCFLRLSGHKTYLSLHIKNKKVKVDPKNLILTIYEKVYEDKKINNRRIYQYTYENFIMFTVGDLMYKIRQNTYKKGLCLIYRERELMPNESLKQIIQKQEFYEIHIEIILVEKHQRVIFYKKIQNIDLFQFNLPNHPLAYYTQDNLYKKINQLLRGLTTFNLCQQNNKQDFMLIRKIIESLNMLPPFIGQVYRGMKFKISRHYKQGDILIFQNFTSTSKSENQAKQFLKKKKNQNTQSTQKTLLHIKSYTGRYIKQFSAYPYQQQVLFAPFTYFYIEKIKQKSDKGQYEQIWLTECPTSKMNFKNLVIWIDDKHDKNKQHFQILKQIQQKYPECQVLMYDNNIILQKWLQEFTYMIYKKNGSIRFVSNMRRYQGKTMKQKAGVQLIHIFKKFGLLDPILFFVGDQDKAKKKLSQDEDVRQSLYKINTKICDFIEFCNFEDNKIVEGMQLGKKIRIFGREFVKELKNDYLN